MFGVALPALPSVQPAGTQPPGTFGLAVAHFLVTQSLTQRSSSAKTWGQAVWRHRYLRDFPEPASLGREHSSGNFEFRSQGTGASTPRFFCSLHPDSAWDTRLGPPLVVVRAVTNPAAIPSGPSGDRACTVHDVPHRATMHHEPSHPTRSRDTSLLPYTFSPLLSVPFGGPQQCDTAFLPRQGRPRLSVPVQALPKAPHCLGGFVSFPFCVLFSLTDICLDCNKSGFFSPFYFLFCC